MKVLVVCARRYNGHELWTALGVMQEKGIDFEVVSTSLTICDERTLRPNILARTVYQVTKEEAQKFDGLMIVSGNMDDTEAYWHDEHVQNLVIWFNEDNRAIAAICCSAPTVAPVAKDKKVSFYPLVRSRQRLQQFGALLQTTTISVDHNLVTAEHQMATQMWTEEFVHMLKDEPPEHIFHDSGFVPRGRPRRMPIEIEEMINKAIRDDKKK